MTRWIESNLSTAMYEDSVQLSSQSSTDWASDSWIASLLLPTNDDEIR